MIIYLLITFKWRRKMQLTEVKDACVLTSAEQSWLFVNINHRSVMWLTGAWRETWLSSCWRRSFITSSHRISHPGVARRRQARRSPATFSRSLDTPSMTSSSRFSTAVTSSMTSRWRHADWWRQTTAIRTVPWTSTRWLFVTSGSYPEIWIRGAW